MRSPHRPISESNGETVKLGFRFAVSGVVIVLSLMLLIYPAVTVVCLVVADSQL